MKKRKIEGAGGRGGGGEGEEALVKKRLRH